MTTAHEHEHESTAANGISIVGYLEDIPTSESDASLRHELAQADRTFSKKSSYGEFRNRTCFSRRCV